MLRVAIFLLGSCLALSSAAPLFNPFNVHLPQPAGGSRRNFNTDFDNFFSSFPSAAKNEEALAQRLGNVKNFIHNFLGNYQSAERTVAQGSNNLKDFSNFLQDNFPVPRANTNEATDFFNDAFSKLLQQPEIRESMVKMATALAENMLSGQSNANADAAESDIESLLKLKIQ